MLCLHILQSSLGLVNTLMIQAHRRPARVGRRAHRR